MNAPFEAYGLLPITVPMPFFSGDVNMYLYDGGEALTLFDAAIPSEEAWQALRQALARRGATVRDIRRVVLTHHHLDHTGLVGRVVDESGAEICGHPEIPLQMALAYSFDDAYTAGMTPMLEGFGMPSGLVAGMLERRLFQQPFVCRVDRLDCTLEDGTLFDGFRVVHVPGHSPTDTLFVHETGGFSITGDHILEGTVPNPILRRPSPGQARGKSLVQFEESLRRSRTLELGWSFPGHGTPFSGHRPLVDRILSTHEKRNQRIQQHAPRSRSSARSSRDRAQD